LPPPDEAATARRDGHGAGSVPGCWTASREELRLAIVTWMERAHHRKRRQRALGRLTPIEFETIQQVAPSAW